MRTFLEEDFWPRCSIAKLTSANIWRTPLKTLFMMSAELGFLDCLLHDPMYGSELIEDDDFESGKMDLLSTSLHENGLLHNSTNHSTVKICRYFYIFESPNLHLPCRYLGWSSNPLNDSKLTYLLTRNVSCKSRSSDIYYFDPSTLLANLIKTLGQSCKAPTIVIYVFSIVNISNLLVSSTLES